MSPLKSWLNCNDDADDNTDDDTDDKTHADVSTDNVPNVTTSEEFYEKLYVMHTFKAV